MRNLKTLGSHGAREREAVPIRPGPGVSLERLLELGPLTAAEAVAVAFALFAELRRLEPGGRQHGAVTSRNVMVGTDGRVSLVGRTPITAEEAPTGADVQGAGDVICRALGITASGAEDGRVAPVEFSEPELAVAARALAQGALGRTPQVAELGFRARVPRLADPERVADSRVEIGRLVVRAESGSRRTLSEPSLGPLSLPVPRPSAPAADPRPSRARPLAALSACVVLLACLAVGAPRLGLQLPGQGALRGAPAAAPTSGPAALAVVPPATPTPAEVHALPDYGPPAAGGLAAVEAASLQSCSPGQSCSIQISIRYSGLGSQPSFGWEVHAFDRCTGAEQVVGNGVFAPPAGWNHIQVTTPAAVPASYRSAVLVVVSSRPARAASSPLELPTAGC